MARATGSDPGLPEVWADLARVGSDVLALPFDVMREHYARSVRAGLIQRSLLASARFEQAISAMERATLGAMARRY